MNDKNMTIKVILPFRYDLEFRRVKRMELTDKGELLLWFRSEGYQRYHKIKFPRNKTEREFEYMILKEE